MGMVDFKLGDVGKVFTGLREAITGEKIVDPVRLAEIAKELDELENKLLTGQIEINKIEAASSNIFIAGWRPMVGWIGAFSLAYGAILEPLARFVSVVAFDYEGVFPVLDTMLTLQILLAMLGIGGMRSFDKKQGTDTKKIK